MSGVASKVVGVVLLKANAFETCTRKVRAEICTMAWVYMLASYNNETLYTGATENIEGRIWERQTKQHVGFTGTYNVVRLA